MACAGSCRNVVLSNVAFVVLVLQVATFSQVIACVRAEWMGDKLNLNSTTRDSEVSVVSVTTD